MNPIKIIALSDWLRLIFGGVFAGLAIYGLVHEYYQIAWIAVPVAVLIGAMSCFACETMVEAVVKASLAAVIVFVVLRTIPKMMEHEPDWRKIALVSLPLGFIGGMGVGSLLGGICRLFLGASSSQRRGSTHQRKRHRTSRAWQPAIAPMGEFGACPAGTTTLRSLRR